MRTQSQRHTRPCQPLWQASPCLSVWHGVGRGASEMPGLCVLRYINGSHRTYTVHRMPGDTGLTHPPSSIHASLSFQLFPICLYLVPRLPLFPCVGAYVCVCRLIGDALCAICSKPPTTHTLPTHHKDGLNHLCASVFPQFEKKDSRVGVGGCSKRCWGCHGRH